MGYPKKDIRHNNFSEEGVIGRIHRVLGKKFFGDKGFVEWPEYEDYLKGRGRKMGHKRLKIPMLGG
jgi:hypothetical protein